MIIFRPFDFIDGAFGGRTSHSILGAALGETAVRVVQLRQIHSDRIFLLRRDEDVPSASFAEGDALVCSLPQVALWIHTADCVPVLLAHPRGIVAAVHAGWRGTAARILEKTIAAMVKTYPIEASDLRMSMGPAICGRCYTVGQEVAESCADLKNSSLADTARPGKFFLDLKRANVLQALRVGVPQRSMEIRPECTFCDSDRFFSYRRMQAQQGQGEGGHNRSWIRMAI